MSLFPHYLKVAARNMRRYPLQTVISVVGLAAGFVCLSLSALWLQYENTYNASLPGSDRLYVLDGMNGTSTPGGLLMKYAEMPEVECATHAQVTEFTLSDGNQVEVVYTDSCFGEMFDVKIVAGDTHLFQPTLKSEMVSQGLLEGNGIAISQSLARRLYGNEDPIGKIISWGFSAKVSAGFMVTTVFADIDHHSDVWGDILFVQYEDYQRGSWSTYITKLQPGQAVYDSFCQKVDAHVEWEGHDPEHLHPIRLTDLHRLGMKPSTSLSYAHLQAFLLVSILLVVCALANFLTFWLNRLRGRRREMALRAVHGASGPSLVGMLCCEVLLVMLLACAFGLLTIIVLQEPFCTYAEIASSGFVLSRSMVFMAVALAACFLLSLVAVVIARRSTAHEAITTAHASGHRFMSVSTGVQVAVSLCFVFCALVMLRQLRFMRDYDWGIRYKDVGAFQFDGLAATSNSGFIVFNSEESMDQLIKGNALADKMKSFAGIHDVLDEGNHPLGQQLTFHGIDLRMKEEDEPVGCIFFVGIQDPSDPVYSFTVVEGKLPNEETWLPHQLIITEHMRDALGLQQAVGQTVKYHESSQHTFDGTVVCVIRDIAWGGIRQNGDAKFTNLVLRPLDAEEKENWHNFAIYFTYEPTQKEAVEEQFREAMKERPDVIWHLAFADDALAKLMKSEINLSRLLTFVTLVAVLIAFSLMFSIITLACRQRRKEIAIRKVHGAERRDVILLFVREYGLILLLAAVAAFAAGFLIMHRWLEQYLHPAGIPWWLYIVLLAAAALLIALCVGSRILRTARENPADVVKSE